MASAAAAAAKTASTHRAWWVQGTHQFEIAGYGALKALDGRHSIASGAFRVAGHDWAVVCCFDSHRLDSVCLELSSASDVEAMATCSFTILEPRGKAAMRIASIGKASVFSRWSRTCEHRLPGAFHLREPRYVKDDRLTIRCAVQVLEEAQSPTRSCLVAAPPPANIAGCLGTLLESRQRWDVTFAVEESKFEAHRLVLAARSPVFRAMFFGDTRDSTQVWFRIQDVTAAAFGAMLHFVYTDELPAGCMEGTAKQRTAMAGDLLVAADLYDLERLRLMCERTLSELSKDDGATALATLALVNGRHSCRQLEDLCVGYVADKWDAVAATEEYSDLKTSCPGALFNILERLVSSLSHRSSSSAPIVGGSKETSKSVYRWSDVSRGTHQFTILGYSDVQRRHGVGQCVRSGTFQVGGHDWAILCYPSGYTDSETMDVRLELRTPLDLRVVRAQASFKIGGPDAATAMELGDGEYKVFTVDTPSSGQHLSVESAKWQCVDQQDRLSIQCHVCVAAEEEEASASPAAAADDIAVPPSNIAWHMEQLLESKMGSDVAFVVEDTKFHAHVLVLSARSPALLQGGGEAPEPVTKNKTKKAKKRVIRIDGVDAVAFKAMLHFIYTDELPPLEELVQASPTATSRTRMAGELLAAADRYGLVRRMGPLCENLLCDAISPQTVAATLTLAERHHRPELKAFCAGYVSSPGVLKAVVASEEYSELKASNAEAEALGRIMDCIAVNFK